MTTRRDTLKQALDRNASGLSVRHLAAVLSEDESAEALGAVELLCVLSPDLRFEDGTWRTTSVGKAATVLSALEHYVSTTGKRIFRTASAIDGLPAEILPTEDEMVQIIENSGGRFKLLPNQMIKFHE